MSFSVPRYLVRFPVEIYIFILKLSLASSSSLFTGSHANEFKQDHVSVVYVVLDSYM